MSYIYQARDTKTKISNLTVNLTVYLSNDIWIRTQFEERGTLISMHQELVVQAQDETRPGFSRKKTWRKKIKSIQNKQLDRRDKVNLCTAHISTTTLSSSTNENFVAVEEVTPERISTCSDALNMSTWAINQLRRIIPTYISHPLSRVIDSIRLF